MMNQIPQETFMGMLNSLAMCGAYGAVALAAIGSAVGTGLAGCAALGAWKRRYMANKPAPFALIIFAFYPAIIVVRLKDEEELLTRELAGYEAYKKKVRYRLIPFVW